VLVGLGLGRIGRVATLENTPAVRGMISKVQHLIRTLEVSELTPTVESQLETLRRFNRRAARVETSRFWLRYKDEVPNALVKLEKMNVESTGPTTLTITGRVHSVLRDFDQDEIDAFVLNYRVFTQDNDQLSIRSLSRIYESTWMPAEARQNFEEARAQLNEYFNSKATVGVRRHKNQHRRSRRYCRVRWFGTFQSAEGGDFRELGKIRGNGIHLGRVLRLHANTDGDRLIHQTAQRTGAYKFEVFPGCRSKLGVWSQGIVVHYTAIFGGTSYGANSSRQRHND
jgi:ribosomal L30p/L7e-like protein